MRSCKRRSSQVRYATARLIKSLEDQFTRPGNEGEDLLVLLERISFRKGEGRRGAVSQSVSQCSFVYQWDWADIRWLGRLGTDTNLWTFGWVMQRCSVQPPIYTRWHGDGDVLDVEPQLPLRDLALYKFTCSAPATTQQPADWGAVEGRRAQTPPDANLSLAKCYWTCSSVVGFSNFPGLIPETLGSTILRSASPHTQRAFVPPNRPNTTLI